MVAIDEDAGVASQGSSRRDTLDNLDDAVAATQAAKSEDSTSPEPDAPWFDA